MKTSALPTLEIPFQTKHHCDVAKIDLNNLLKKYSDIATPIRIDIENNKMIIFFADNTSKINFSEKIQEKLNLETTPHYTKDHLTPLSQVISSDPALTRTPQKLQRTKAGTMREKAPIEEDKKNPMVALTILREKGILNKQTPPIPPPPVDYLVFQGGGAKGDTLFGSLSVLDQAGALKEAKIVFGSSVGALTALLVSTGLSGDQIKDFCVDYFNPRNLLDARQSTLGASFAGGILSIAKSLVNTMGGFGEAKTARHVIRNILRHVTGNPECTFAEFEAARKNNPALKDFVCTATWLPSKEEAKKMGLDEYSAGITKLFSSQLTPDVVMADAILASMSLPAVWSPVTIRKKEGNEFISIGTFTDGGVHNNLPIDIVNDFVSNKEYKSLPRKNKKGEIILDNPCGFSFSMCTPKQLNPAICPVPPEVQKFIADNTKKPYHDNTREKEMELENYRVLPPNVLPKERKLDETRKAIRTKATTAKQAVTRKTSVHEEAASSGLKRLLNIVPASDVEDIIEKAQLHPEAHVDLYDGGVGPGDLGMPREKRDQLIMIGDSTTRAFLKEKRDVTKEYKHPDYYQPENLDYLADENSKTNRLKDFFTDLAQEIEKYNQPNAESIGYEWAKMQDNVKIQNLYWKIHYIFNKLEKKPTNDFDEFISQNLSKTAADLKQQRDAQKLKTDAFYNKLVHIEGLVNELDKYIKEQPFDKGLFETAYTSLTASNLIKIINDNPELLLSAAKTNSEALRIILDVTGRSYDAMHQSTVLAEKQLGKARMTPEEAITGFNNLINKAFDEKPLIFHAIDSNQPLSVTALLHHDVSRDVKYEGKSIFQYAIDKGNANCLIAACVAKTREMKYREGRKEFYLGKDAGKFGKFMQITSDNGRNLAHYLFESPHLSNILPTLMNENERVWEKFAKSLNKADKDGITPLQIAAAKLSKEDFRSLRENKIYQKYEHADDKMGADRLQAKKADQYKNAMQKSSSKTALK